MSPATGSPGAVLFDLDDTLFDHDHSSRIALWSLREEHAALGKMPWEELRERYSRLLEEIHTRLLDGELTLQEARRERFRRLLSEIGEEATDALVQRVLEDHAVAYRESWRLVAGAEEVLLEVGTRAKVVVVTNNLLDEQVDKLESLGISGYVDALVASEEVGISKPDPGIFRVALERVGCPVEAAIMVGDSWENDVLGARAAGIRAVWLNRRGVVIPDPALAGEIRDLGSLRMLLGSLADGEKV